MENKILIIDDDESILELLKTYLEYEGFKINLATGAEAAIKYIERKPDLIILDVNMPQINGIEFCRTIRNFVQCPIIFLSGCVTQVDKIAGLEAGGDDYLLKPFDMEELIVRIRAHIRREERKELKREIKITENLIIDFQQKKVFCRSNEVELSKKEFQIIELLVKNRGSVLDREIIYEKIWGFNSEGDSIVVKEHIRRIRNKFQKYGDENYIETVWGVGYRWKNL